MRKRSKSFIEALAILFTLLILASSLFNQNGTELGQPADFYTFSKEVSLEELVDVANNYNKAIYLPTDLPDNLELTTLYLKYSPLISIVVYSAEGNKDYKTAELTIEISASSSPPSYNELVSQAEASEYKSAHLINAWPVSVNERAYAGEINEVRGGNGDYILLIIAWIDGMRYLICCPTLTKDNAVQMVASMSLRTK